MRVHFIVYVTSLWIKENQTEKIRRVCETWLSSTKALLTHLCDTSFICVSLNPIYWAGAELQCLTLGILAQVVSVQLKMQMYYKRFLVSI